ncbi:MAG: hypothetical protein M3044_03920 [Thermoproteota archaeon]|nr:hypothetical protein [Thermoproteota archaeon]
MSSHFAPSVAFVGAALVEFVVLPVVKSGGNGSIDNGLVLLLKVVGCVFERVEGPSRQPKRSIP